VREWERRKDMQGMGKKAGAAGEKLGEKENRVSAEGRVMGEV